MTFHLLENTNTEIKIIKREPDRNSGGEKYKTLNEKFARGAQHQTQIDRGKNQETFR